MEAGSEKLDVLVIGAGPAGTIAAALLHKDGYKVRVVERERFPRFVIGESLLPRSMEALEAAGFLDAISARGFQKKFGAKFVRGSEVCDFNFSTQFTQGYDWTWQVPRAEFDTCLANEVARQGVPVDFETTVDGISFDGTDSTTRVTKNGVTEEITARFVVDASGYGRVLPRLLGLDRPSALPSRKAFFAHIQDPRRGEYHEPDRIIIVSHKTPGVWIWIIPFSNGTASVGYVGTPEFFDAFQGDDEAAFRRMLATDMHTSGRFLANGEKPEPPLAMAPRILQGWSCTTERFYGPGYVLVGNVTEFLDPVFSSGVTLAVSSSQKAAELASKQLAGKRVDWKGEYQDHLAAGVDVFRTYVNAWYDGTLEQIFYAKEHNEEAKKRICSVLAGYVWDLENSFVKRHDRAPKALAERIAAMRA